MNKVLIITLLFASQSVWAQKNKAQTLTLKEKALAEATIVDEKAPVAHSATDAQISNVMLTLKDPRPAIETRNWQYFAGVTLQSFQATGTVTSEVNQTFNLDQSEATLMPGLQVGVLSPEMYTGAVSWQLGFEGKAAYATQRSSGVLESGYVLEDSRLNTTLLSVGPLASARWSRISWLSLNLGMQFGDLNYTQTSSNDFGQFSKHAAYQALSYGLGFQITNSWSVSADWTQRSLQSNSQQLALQKNNFELGTKITW